MQGFVERIRAGAQVAMLNLPGLDIDIEAEIARYKEYAEKDDTNLIIELLSTLKLANRQLRYLENRLK